MELIETDGEAQETNDKNARKMTDERLGDMVPPQSSKFDLAKIFLWQDNTPKYFANGQFEEAFGVLDERYKMGVELRNALSLFNYCVSLMVTEHDHRAIMEKLKLVVAKSKPSSKSVLWLAKRLYKLGKCFASIIICELYFEMFFDASPPYEAFGILEEAVSCIRQSATAIIETEESASAFVNRRILPKMYKMKEKIVGIDVNPYYKCVKAAYVTHCIEVCESRNQERITVIVEMINYMRETLGENNIKNHQIYGTLCNNLGSTYLKLGMRNDAIKFYEKALACFDSATDFEIPIKKEKYIRDTKTALRRAQGLEDEIGTGFGGAETRMPD